MVSLLMCTAHYRSLMWFVWQLDLELKDALWRLSILCVFFRLLGLDGAISRVLIDLAVWLGRRNF